MRLPNRPALIITGLLLCLTGSVATAYQGASVYGARFQRVATFPVYLNNADIAEETVAEIVATSRNGQTLVYTDGVKGAIGIVGIADPENPTPLGTVAVGGEPTSVAILVLLC